jgi:hypothetical protein
METSHLLFTAGRHPARARLDLSAIPSSYLFSWRYALRKYPGQIAFLRLAFDMASRSGFSTWISWYFITSTR